MDRETSSSLIDSLVLRTRDFSHIAKAKLTGVRSRFIKLDPYYANFPGDPGYSKALKRFERAICASKAELADPSFQPDLCQQCRSVKWAALTKTCTPMCRAEIFTHRSTEGLCFTTCKLCNFIAARITGLDSENPGTAYIFMTGSSRREGHRTRMSNPLLCYQVLQVDIFGEPYQPYRECYNLTIRGVPGQHRIYGDFIPYNLRSGSIDYEIPKAWLKSCNISHATSCHTSSPVNFRGFQVIDCNARQVVVAPQDCKYVALSYVWGPGNAFTYQVKLPSRLPLTIEDGITVTLSLGFSYLWVDRFVRYQSLPRIYVGKEALKNIVHRSTRCG